MIDSIHLTDFRNYSRLDLHLGSGLNLVVGPNAQGKTNLLEAIFWISTTKLLRGRREHEAIRADQDACEVQIELTETHTSLGMRLERGARKKALLNGLGLARASDLVGRLPCIAFTNDDMLIVRGEPSDRREFLDVSLAQVFASYLRHFTLYRRALDQRNALLKMAQDQRMPSEHFEVWEAELARHGAPLRSVRAEFLAELERTAGPIHALMGASEALTIRPLLKDAGETEELLLDSLAQHRDNDIHRGATQIGPHRDDIDININGTEARLFGSQGQQRTAAIAIKIATLAFARSHLDHPPIFLLDDVFSELDENRRAKMLEMAGEQAGQILLTCTEPEQAGAEMRRRAHIHHVQNGMIESEKPVCAK